MVRLKERQEKFCIEYFKSGNAAQSAVLAGYSVKAVRSIASRLLTFANIRARLSELQKRAEDASVSSVLERKQILTEIERADLADFVDLNGETIHFNKDHPNHRAVVEFSVTTTYTKQGEQVITKSIKFGNRISAIQEHNKMEKVYDETPKVNVNVDQRQTVFQVVNVETQDLVTRIQNGERTEINNDLPAECQSLPEST